MPQKQESLPNGTIVFTNDTHKISSDSLLLAAFSSVKPRWSACDLGAGCGILLLSLFDQGLAGPATAVELAPDACDLLAAAQTANPAHPFTLFCGDLRQYTSPRPFDLVLANPPYFSAGALPPSAARAAARHETTCTLAEFCSTAAHILKDGGRFCLCYPPDRLAELFAILTAKNLAPKRMQLVRKTPDAAPWLALVEAHKFGGTGLAILPDNILSTSSPLWY